MVGDGVLDVPSKEIRFTLYPVHFTAGASPRPTIIDIVSREGGKDERWRYTLIHLSETMTFSQV